MNDEIDELPPLTKLRCQIPEVQELHGKTIEYIPHMDYDERIPPTEQEADLLCRTAGVMCPLAEYCNALGLVLEAPTGVWGGKVVVDGKNYYDKKEEND